MSWPDITPAMTARADQELAACDTALELLVELWRQRAAERQVDRMRLVAIFMIG
jgi:hypothetical protein